MTFQNPPAAEVKALLARAKTIAVVGLSPDPDRPSYSVSLYMQRQGYRIVPVRPGGGAVLGESFVARLADLPFPVDIVDVFRASAHVPAHVDEVLALPYKPALWLQEGVIDDDAAARAQAAGLFVVMDRCLLKEHRRRG
ncbi:MAG: CoA-binding protein [Myxococcales bacterium]